MHSAGDDVIRNCGMRKCYFNPINRTGSSSIVSPLLAQISKNNPLTPTLAPEVDRVNTTCVNAILTYKSTS